MVAVGAASGFALYRTQEVKLLDLVSMGADQLSRGITSATWHAMLADRRDDAYQVMATIAAKQGIDRIRMFNSFGDETFSTVAGGTQGHPGVKSVECRGCHELGKKLGTLRLQDRIRVHPTDSGTRSLSIITPIPNEKSCSQAACHAHPATEKILGVLEVEVKLDVVDAELASLQQVVVLRAAVELAIICALIIVFTRRFVRRPIHELIASTHEISNMNLDEPIQVGKGSGEIADLARSFDAMRVRLKEAVDEINQFTQKLETKVEERTKQLQVAHQKLVQSDRMASPGAAFGERGARDQQPGLGSAEPVHADAADSEGRRRAAGADRRLPAVSGADHERDLAGGPDRERSAGVFKEAGAAQVGGGFERGDPEYAFADLAQAEAEQREVRLELDEKLPHVQCDPSQMQQVVLNLVLNASEAMQGREAPRGRCPTGSGDGSDGVVAESPTTARASAGEPGKIFDPFFTTKPEGKGVGLGLAVTYGIVQAHGGEIDVKSAPGKARPSR